jgi:hypothetical protein
VLNDVEEKYRWTLSKLRAPHVRLLSYSGSALFM